MTFMSLARLARRLICILCYEWGEYPTFQKVLKTTHTSCFTMTFMPLVLSGSLSLVRRPTSILRYEWRDNSTFQKVPETTHTSWVAMILSIFRFSWLENPVFEKVQERSHSSFFAMTLMSLVHSTSLILEQRPTSILRYEWCQNSTFQKLPKATYTSCLTMTFMSLARLARRLICILCYEWGEYPTFQKVLKTTHTSCFTMTFISLETFWKFESCSTPNQYSQLWVTWELSFSESAGDNSYFLACDDFDDSCTFCKFKSFHREPERIGSLKICKVWLLRSCVMVFGLRLHSHSVSIGLFW